MSDIFDLFQSEYSNRQPKEFSLQEWLEETKTNPMLYATASERLLKAIGTPRVLHTSEDPRLSRIFCNKVINIYPAFEDEFFGLEEPIENMVSFFKHAALGLEESKQIMYMLGPVGAAKSSIAEKLKDLMEVHPIYVLQVNDQTSPVFESPLGLFSRAKHGKVLSSKYSIDERYLSTIASSWAVKRLKELNGDISKFKVVQMWPSRLHQISITKVEPGDENNQDISALVGKVDIRKLEHFAQNDADAYSYSGGLCLGNQGLVEEVEIWKQPIKTLHPLLTALQERNYNTVEGFALPFTGIVIAHSNESEWGKFKGNKDNEAFLDRVVTIKFPYCTRMTEEEKVYWKMKNNSALRDAPCAPETFGILAKFSVLTRIIDPENSNKMTKMEVYNGEIKKDTDTSAKSVQEYRDTAGPNEGMSGYSTRSMHKVISATFSYDKQEPSPAANPVHAMTVLLRSLEQEYAHDKKTLDEYKTYLKALGNKYGEFLEKEIKMACLESYDEYGQNMFDNYVLRAQAWIKEIDYKDPDTGSLLNRELLDLELSKVEKPAKIANPKEFRQEIVMFSLEAIGRNKGQNPKWTSYKKMKDVIERKIFQATEDIMPIITFNPKATSEQKKAHEGFLERMKKKGYTERQVRILAEWWRMWKDNQQ